jgi:hypothetical protein
MDLDSILCLYYANSNDVHNIYIIVIIIIIIIIIIVINIYDMDIIILNINLPVIVVRILLCFINVISQIHLTARQVFFDGLCIS